MLSRRATTDDLPPLARLHPGDLATGQGLDAALAGVQTVLHCATTNGRRDVEATETLLRAASRAGTRHLVYVSIVGVDAIPLPYYRAKLACEYLVLGSGLPCTILRATQFHPLIAQLLDVQRWSPVVILPGRTSFQPVDTGVVADRLVELLPEPQSRVPDLGGPEVQTVQALARTWLRATGRRRVVAAPVLPGATAEAYRAGHQLVPDGGVGPTFADYLAGRGRR